MEQGAPLSHHWGSSLQTLSGDWGEETIWIQYLKQANFSSVLLDCTSQLSNSSETVWPTSCLELLYRYKLFFFFPLLPLAAYSAFYLCVIFVKAFLYLILPFQGPSLLLQGLLLLGSRSLTCAGFLALVDAFAPWQPFRLLNGGVLVLLAASQAQSAF